MSKIFVARTMNLWIAKLTDLSREKQIRNVKIARTWHPARGLTVTILDPLFLKGDYLVIFGHTVDSNMAPGVPS